MVDDDSPGTVTILAEEADWQLDMIQRRQSHQRCHHPLNNKKAQPEL
jgi:hypothetical protein